jgi:RHS repeat-associated protein
MNLCIRVNKRIFCLFSGLVAFALLPARASENPINFDDVIGLRVDVEDSTGEDCSGVGGMDNSSYASLSGGDGGCAVKLAITVTGSVETQNAGYDFVYVNDVLFFSSVVANGNCDMIPKTATKTITVNPGDDITLTYDTVDGRYHTGAYATITNIELVEEGCSSGCEAGGGSMENGSIHVGLNLGRANFGESVGALRIVETVPSAVLGTPSSLRYSSDWPGVEVIRDGNDAIRQVKAPQCLADVVTETADKFRVDFYDANNFGQLSGGLYDQTGKSAYVSWVVENVDTVNNEHLKITQVKGTISVVNEFIWDATAQGWDLLEGNGQRKEKKTVVVDSTANTRTVTSVVRNAANGVVSKIVKTYKDFPWGRELIQSVVDPDGAALTTSRSFYDNSTTDGKAYGKLKSVINPGGGWATYQYDAVDGRLAKTVEPFLDAEFGSADNLCKVTTVAYLDEAPQETRIVTILGQEVGRSYKVFSDDTDHITRNIVCTVPGAAYDDETNLVSASKLVSEAGPAGDFTGDIEWISNPDGTRTTYEYSKTSTQKTVIARQGDMSWGWGWVDSGTQTTTITDIAGNLISEMVVDIESYLTLSLKTVPNIDAFGRPTVIDNNDGTTETINYGCCGIDSRTDREGITTSYTYDAFKRVLTESRAGVTMSFTYDAEGRVLTRKRIGSDSSEILQETNVYDVAGRLVSTTDALNNPTGYAHTIDGSGRDVETVTHPDLGTEITVHHKDGRVYEVSGTAAVPRRMFYGVETGVGYFERSVNISSTGGLDEWTKTWQDIAGRVVTTQQNGRAAASRHYNLAGRLEKTVDPDGVTILHSSDSLGNLTSTILDVDRDGIASATDRIETTTRQVLGAHGTVVRRTEQRIVNAAGVEELVSQTDISADGRSQWITRWGQASSAVVTYGAGATRTETFTRPDNSTETRSYSQGRIASETVAASGGTPVLKSVSYLYDPHGRLESATDARNGATSFTYDDMDRVLSVTTPAPGPGLPAQTTGHLYDSMGRETVTTLPDLTETTTGYFLTGLIKKRSGSQVPTVDYTYDSQGRSKTMLTTGQAGPATTTWSYQDTTGWLEGKLYPGGDTISYTHTDAGRRLTRNTGRGVQRTYGYDQGGRLTGIDYSDTTPDVIYGLNRLGQVTHITDGAGTRTRSVATDGRLLSETHNSGLLSGVSATYGYDAFLRRETFSTNTGGPAFDVTWDYDGASRLQTITSGADSTTYTYAGNSGLVTGMITERTGTPRLTTSTSYDAVERLTSIASSNGSTVVSSHTYAYDALNRRTESVLADGSEWNYRYDDMGQVILGEKRTGWNAPVPGMKFGYTFDGIGNRESATVNGRTGTYTPDVANQYDERQVPGALDIRGRASTAARVTVNTGLTQRLDEYFYKALAIDNGTAPQYPGVSVLAVQNNAGPNGEDVQSETTGNHFLAKTPEVFTHDAEGNLTSDGRWEYTWDGENRLIRQETIASVPSVAKRKLEFVYDAENRRIRKQVFIWSDSAWVLHKDLRFLYDDWNLVAELDATNTMLRNFVWGLDLSRTPQGAGGVGGLLAIRAGTESYLPAFDGNGNVMTLVKASDQSVSARYEYGPFGETLVVEEDGISNPFRFSTKYHDSETGLYYYGYRYYDPVTGRWPSRDPIEEEGGVNLYGFVGNDGVNLWDVLGLELPDNLKCCKIKKIIVNFNQVKEAPNHKVSEDGMYNHKTGRLFLGTITVSCADGNSKDWDTQTGGMRMKTSAVRGPGDRNPLGDDSAAPAGDFTVSTSPSGGTKGYLINTSGTNRDLIKIHYASYEGSHGCATSRDPEEWKIFAELMALNKATYRQNSVPIRIQYVGVSPPVGNRGNGKSDPPIVPIALPVPSGF